MKKINYKIYWCMMSLYKESFYFYVIVNLAYQRFWQNVKYADFEKENVKLFFEYIMYINANIYNTRFWKS